MIADRVIFVCSIRDAVVALVHTKIRNMSYVTIVTTVALVLSCSRHKNNHGNSYLKKSVLFYNECFSTAPVPTTRSSFQYGIIDQKAVSIGDLSLEIFELQLLSSQCKAGRLTTLSA
jgi:hypothetical protein